MQHFLRHYIDYYLDLDFPEYAILVTGPWGVGKTHQVRQLLPDGKAYYISLFGLSKVSEIHDAVFAEVEPTLTTAKKYLPPLIGALSSATQVPQLNFLTPGLFQALLRKRIKPQKLLIFDDLERSTVEPTDLIGAINIYVEHHKCKVVIIAHDEKFVSALNLQKEKIIGHTVRAFPQADAAFDKFLTRCASEPFRSFMSEHKVAILSLFAESQFSSLRLLRSIIGDLSRLYAILKKNHVDNEQAVKELISLHIALNLEVRSGCLAEKDLATRSNHRTQYVSRSSDGNIEGDDTPPIVKANNKYKSVDLYDRILSGQALVEMLIYGVYSADTILASIESSAHFLKVKAEETPSWKLIYKFDQLEDSIIDKAQIDMEDQFRQRAIEEPGEFLHIFALMMMMAEFAITNKTIEQVSDECRQYVRDLVSDNRLPPLKLETEGREASLDVYDGFQYWVTDTYREKFGELREYVQACRQVVLEKKLSVEAADVLEKLKENASRFSDLISFSPSSAGRFAANSILHNIEPPEFVDAWLSNDKSEWHHVKRALEDRYSVGARFTVERDWIEKVIVVLNEAAKREKGFRAARILRVVPRVERIKAEQE